MGDLLGGRAEVVHVAHEGRREHLPRALPAIGAAVHHVARDGHCGAHAGAADPHLRIAVHRAEDHHRLAHAGLDDADRNPDQRLGRRSPAEHVHVEIEADAEVAGDEWREHRVVELIRQHAVDLGRFQSGVDHGVAHRDRCERPRRLVGAAHVVGLTDADNGIFVAQEFRRRGVDIFSRQRHS